MRAAIQEWHKLPAATRRNIFIETARKIGLPDAAAEKDWWVVQTLHILFGSSIGNATVFKGGTSLSKGWKLLDRFSEDIDLALDRRFLGFDQELSGAQVRKLRRKSVAFIRDELFPEIQLAFQTNGFEALTIQLGELKNPDQDPLTIEVYYPSLTDPVTYLPPRVLIEIGSRSLIEPFSAVEISSFVNEQFAGNAFTADLISVPTVNPERTFLEKIFLLHETFQQPVEKVKVERKSRHLYDLERLMDTNHAAKALAEPMLYEHIVAHRQTVTPIRGIDYALHRPASIAFLPPEDQLSAWEADYKEMQQSMFYNESVSFDRLMKRLQELQHRINQLNW